MSPKYNPRYEAFCRAHGKTVEEMLQHEGLPFFGLWNTERWNEFEAEVKEKGDVHICRRCRADRFADEYDVWLQERFP